MQALVQWWFSQSLRRRKTLLVGTFAVLVVVAITLFVVFQEDILDVSSDFVEYTESVGPAGYLIFAGGLVVSHILPLPFVFLTLHLVGSFVLGFPVALACSLVAAVVGLALIVVAVKTRMRDFMFSLLSHSRYFEKIDIIVREHDWKFIWIMRLTPLPVGSINWISLLLTADSETGRVWFAYWQTTASIVPEILLFLWAGSTIRDISDVGDSTPQQQALTIVQVVGLVFAIGVFVVISRRVVRMIEHEIAESEQGSRGSQTEDHVISVVMSEGEAEDGRELGNLES